MVLVLGFWTFLRAVFFGSAAVSLENVALRHQLRVLQRSVSRPRLARWDRILWVWLSRVWVSWRSSLVIVQPATVRRGFQLYWRWESWAPSVGRPRLDPELRVSSGAWLARTPPGAAGASAQNSLSSATTSPN
jgi:putative transposase